MPRLTSFSQSAFVGMGVTRGPVPLEGFIFNFDSAGFDEVNTSTASSSYSMTQISTSQKFGYHAYAKQIGPDFNITSYTSSLTNTTDALTMEGWLYVNQLPSGIDRHVFGIHRFNAAPGGSYQGDGYCILDLSSSGYIGTDRQNGGSGTASNYTALGAVSTGAWNHVAFVVYGDNKIQTFVNGSGTVLSDGAGFTSAWDLSFHRYVTFGKHYDFNSLEMYGDTGYGLSQVRLYSGIPDWLASRGSTSYTMPTASW